MLSNENLSKLHLRLETKTTWPEHKSRKAVLVPKDNPNKTFTSFFLFNIKTPIYSLPNRFKVQVIGISAFFVNRPTEGLKCTNFETIQLMLVWIPLYTFCVLRGVFALSLDGWFGFPLYAWGALRGSCVLRSAWHFFLYIYNTLTYQKKKNVHTIFYLFFYFFYEWDISSKEKHTFTDSPTNQLNHLMPHSSIIHYSITLTPPPHPTPCIHDSYYDNIFTYTPITTNF